MLTFLIHQLFLFLTLRTNITIFRTHIVVCEVEWFSYLKKYSGRLFCGLVALCFIEDAVGVRWEGYGMLEGIMVACFPYADLCHQYVLANFPAKRCKDQLVVAQIKWYVKIN
ncbi:hypothetical protein RchiOBHm_Chr2g0156521 [Rosa chinensis]|uniref:Uncharacterized protein n=1 Tax=Rosa chinensis TaxID=74649 RepID=A0A2P6S1H3_ROSCH|nr:hypothetical protein RchiOBHm_Chr2g0156521 [Rosa chinensis]